MRIKPSFQGRKKDIPVTFYISEHDLQRLDETATSLGVSRSWFIREALAVQVVQEEESNDNQ